MLATDGTQMHFDIALLRKAIKVNKDAKTLAIEASPALAWKIVDAGYAANQAIPVCRAPLHELAGTDTDVEDGLGGLPRARGEDARSAGLVQHGADAVDAHADDVLNW
jgi:hypothetical protein